MRKIQILKPSFEKWCNYCRIYGHSIDECRQKQQDNQNKPQKYKEPNKSLYQNMKKDQNLTNKNIRSNNSSGKPLPNSSNHSRYRSPYNSNYRGRSPDKRNSRNPSQNRYSRSHSRNTHYRNIYSRSYTIRQNYSFDTSSHSHPRNRHYSKDRSRNSSYNRHRSLKLIIQTIDQITKDLIITIIKIDLEKIHNKGIQTIDKETTLIHLIGITHDIQTLKTNIEVIHQNIRDK